jgi:cytoskeleton protein RodZ
LTERRAIGVGTLLARAREEQGLALADIAQQLKFAPRQLEALEEERFEELPGLTFARGMVRNYARLLKLDAEPLLDEVSQRFDTPDANQLAQRFRQPVPFSDSGKRSTLAYLGVSIGILAVVGGIAFQWQQERAKLANEALVSASAPVPEAPRAPPLPPQQVAALNEPAPAPAIRQEIPAPNEVVTVKSASGGHRIVLRCDEEAWLEVTDGLGRQLLSSLNPAGTERTLRGTPPFSVVIGNAQHVRVTYNDRAIDLAPHIRVQVARLTLK